MADDPGREPPLRSSPRLHLPEQARDQSLCPFPRLPPAAARSTGGRGLFGRGRGDGRGRGASKTAVAWAASAPRVRRSVSRFTEEETDDMLTAIQEVLPIGPQEWERVVEIHARTYPETQRDAASLRRKFSQLYSTTAPTGDPNIPANVYRAKAIRNAIETRADTDDMSAGCDNIPIAVGDIGLPDDEEEVLDKDQELDDSNNGGNELDGSVSGSVRGTQQGVGSIRRLREVSPRPLVRTQASAGRATSSNSSVTADAVQSMLLNMMQQTQRADAQRQEERKLAEDVRKEERRMVEEERREERRMAEEERREERRRYDERMEERREERRQQMEAQQQVQQMNMTMMMAMVTAANPSASQIMNQANKKRSRKDESSSDE